MTLQDQQVNMPVKSNEWYTPSKYIEAARQVMGSIDLDPASCFEANQTVKADRYYTQVENGLEMPWYGRVWCNPPYSMDNSQPNGRKSGIKKWVEKLVNEYRVGNVNQAIALVTAQTDVSWFISLWDYPLCFSDHSVRFHTPYGRCAKSNPAKATWQTNGHQHGTCFVYLGFNQEKFIDIFSQFGPISKRISKPKQVQTPSSLWEVAV